MKYETTDKIMLITIIIIAIPFVLLGLQLLTGNTSPALTEYLQSE